MQEILNLLPVLCVAIIMNIGLGMYYNIGTQEIKFDLKKLLTGIVKAIIIAGSFIGLAYCFETTDLSSIGVTPELLMTSAIVIYVTKATISLSKILGIETAVPYKNKK